MYLYLRYRSVAQILKVDWSDKFPSKMILEPEGSMVIALEVASLAQVSIKMSGWSLWSLGLYSRKELKSRSEKVPSLFSANLFLSELNNESWKNSLFLRIGRTSKFGSES